MIFLFYKHDYEGLQDPKFIFIAAKTKKMKFLSVFPTNYIAN